MEPSSRIPEGDPNRCPICGHDIRVEPSIPPGDAPCPYCGHLFWFDTQLPLQPIVEAERRVWILVNVFGRPVPVDVQYSEIS